MLMMSQHAQHQNILMDLQMMRSMIVCHVQLDHIAQQQDLNQ